MQTSLKLLARLGGSCRLARSACSETLPGCVMGVAQAGAEMSPQSRCPGELITTVLCLTASNLQERKCCINVHLMPMCSLATAQFRQCLHLCPYAVAPTARSPSGSSSPRVGRAGKPFSHHHARSYAAAALPDVSLAPSVHSHHCHGLVALHGQACALSCELIAVFAALQPLSDDSEEEEPAPRPGMAPLPDRIGFVGAGQVQLNAP